MAVKDLTILISAKDEASKTLTGIEKSLKSLEPGFKQVSKIGAIGFTALAGAVGLTIKAFQESEIASARLEQIATQVTGATMEEIEGFKRLSEELQKVGVVEDDVIKAGQSQLASFAKSSSTVTTLSDDLADLAVAQYGVNVSQDQAIQTANLMGKALTGNLGALTRTGILVSDDFKKAFEEANTEQERAVILSQIIQDNYGGLNEKLKETSAGGIQSLKNSFGDLMEVIGENFVPILTMLVERITPIVERFSAWAKENGDLITKIVLIGGAILGTMAILYPVLKVITTMISLFKMVGTVISLLASPIGLVVLALVALVAFGWVVYKNWDSIVAGIRLMWEGLLEFFNTVGEFIMGMWQRVFDFFNFVGNGIMTMWQNVFNFFANSVNWFIGIANKIGDFMAKTFEGIGEIIKNAFKGAINFVIDKLNWLINKFNSLVIGGINLVPGVNINKIGTIPKLAEGGIVNKPTLALIGEAGPEAVVPLGKKGGAGNTYNIYLNGTYLDKQAGEKIGDMIIKKLKLSNSL